MKKILFFLLTIILILLISGCTPPQQPTPQQGLGVLTGLVKGELENTVIYKAEVVAIGGGKTFKTSTEMDGEYTLHLPEGTYEVTASMETFDSDTKSVSISANQTKTQDFTLTTPAEGDSPTFEPQGWLIIGATLPTALDTKVIDAKALKEENLDKVIDWNKVKTLKNVNKVEGVKEFSSYVAVMPEIPAIPWGLKGVRLYISTSPDGPFTLLGRRSIEEGVEEGIQVFSLNPETTYYCRLAIYGTWGEEEITTSPLLAQTPKPLTLLNPENNAEVQSPINFQWSDIGEGFSYEGDILDQNLCIKSIFEAGTSTSYGYTDTLSYGNYYWLVAGIKEESEPEGTFLKRQISFSYFRFFTFLPAGPNLIQNGDFNNYSIDSWTEEHGTQVQDDWYVNADDGYLHWYRAESYNNGGLVGAYQEINYNLTGKTKLVLSFDIIIYNQKLTSDGWSGGEYPAQVQLIFEDGSGNTYVYKKSYLVEGSEVNYPQNNVSLISLNTWTHFEFDLMSDPTIVSQISSHPILKRIRVFGNGWDFEGGADNIYVGAQ